MHIRRLTDEETGTLIFCEKWYIAITANVSQYQPHDKNTYHGNVDSSITCSNYFTKLETIDYIIAALYARRHEDTPVLHHTKLNSPTARSDGLAANSLETAITSC